jgi:Protein of unknown function (DUF1097)
MKKTLLLATSIAVLAGIWTVIVFNIGKFGAIPFVLWPTFVAWAAFFYLGGTTDGMVKALIQLFWGAILSGLFIWIYSMLGLTTDPGWIVLGIIVIIIAWPLTAMSAVSKWFSAVPAGFCGAASWFGVSAGNAGLNPLQTTIATMIPLLCGVLLGWLSLWIVVKMMPEKK